jgi:hypothetical protein
MILINVKKHSSYEDLKHTIIHELVHYRFRYLKHGIRFENRLSLIQKGKRYKAKVLYPENPLLSSFCKKDHENMSQCNHRQSCCNHISGFNTESGFWIINDVRVEH